MSIVGVGQLELFHNPRSTNSSNIGVCIGSFKGEDLLVGEDSALFKKELGYSMVAKKGLLVFRYPSASAQQGWPSECQKQLRFGALTKYKWIYERLLRLEQQLLGPSTNVQRITMTNAINERTHRNFPKALGNARTNFKGDILKRNEQNQQKYLAINNKNYIFALS